MIRRFQNLPEALLTQGSLDSSGIECFLTDDNMVRMDWFISNLLGGVKFLVNREDVEAATAILDEPTPELLDVEGVGEYQQPRCPECHYLDVNFEQLNRKVAYTTASLGIPIPLHTAAWTCRSCGHQWQDRDSIEPYLSNNPDAYCCLIAAKLSSRIRVASSTSAFPIFNGGDMRITLP